MLEINSVQPKNKKAFKFGKIPDELKQMFLSFGIKKRDLENDVDFAFTLFKKVIVGLGTENKLKNSALDSIQHNFLPPSEREKLLRQEEAADAKMHTKKKTIKKKAPKPKPKPIRPMAGKRASVPLAPPPPPPPPPPPSVPSAVPNKRASAAINVLKPTPKPEVDVQTQLQNYII